MRRDWDVVRRIMLKVEELPTEDGDIDSEAFPDVDNAVAAYHMRIMIEAGLIEGGFRGAMGPPWAYVHALTWLGHELLDSIRSETTWTKMKSFARDRGVELTIESIKTVAKAFVEGMVKG